MKAIGKEFGKLDSSKEFKVILCSSSIYNVINGSVRGSLLKEMLEERFPKIWLWYRNRYMRSSKSYNIVGMISLDEVSSEQLTDLPVT